MKEPTYRYLKVWSKILVNNNLNFVNTCEDFIAHLWNEMGAGEEFCHNSILLDTQYEVDYYSLDEFLIYLRIPYRKKQVGSRSCRYTLGDGRWETSPNQ